MTDDKYISGEEHRQMHVSSRQSKKVTIPVGPVLGIVLVVLLCGVSFAGGIAYQKHNTKTTTASNFAAMGGVRRQGGGIGTVSAISSTSITVTSQRTNTDKTYTINSSTTITNNGQTASVSDIQTGDMVIVVPTSSTSNTASRILVNPSFGGGFGGGTQTAPDSSSGQTN